jgi:hypothetical protein
MGNDAEVGPPPAWKFWHPLPFWHALVIFFVAQFVVALPVVFLREALGIGIPTAAIGAGAGFLGVMVTLRRAAKARAARPG